MFGIEYETLEIKETSYKYDEKAKRKIMTMGIGIRCKDGVILTSDRKLVTGNFYHEEKKISNPLPNVVFAYSGELAYMEYFMSKTNEYINIHKEGMKLNQFVEYLEDSIYEIIKRYEKRIHDVKFDILLSLKIESNRFDLYHLYSGFSRQIYKFDIIGHGALSGLPFIRTVYSEDITMEQAIELCIFTHQIIDKIDNTVGGKPQIFKMPDNGNAEELSNEKIDKLIKDVKAEERLFNAIFKN